MQPQVLAAFSFVAFIWGTTYLMLKIGVEYWPPLLLTAWRNLIAGVALVLTLLALRRPIVLTWERLWPPMVFSLSHGLAMGLITWGSLYIPSSQVALLAATMPFFTLFIARWWLGDRLTWGKLLAVGLGFAGVAMATSTRHGAGFAGSDAERLLAQIGVAGAGLFYAAAYIFGKRYFRGDTLHNTAMYLLSSGLYIQLLSLLLDPPAGPRLFDPVAIGVLLYVSLLGSALAFWCIFYVMANASPLQTSYVTLINPVVALLLGIVLMGEGYTAISLGGAGLVVAGAWLVNRTPTLVHRAGAGAGHDAGPAPAGPRFTSTRR